MNPQDIELLPQLELFLRLIVAALLGGLIGAEREMADKAAGLRTNMLVCTGSALFTVMSAFGFGSDPSGVTDPARVAAQIVSGIGFLGGGVIFTQRDQIVRGVTTAATIWTVAAIGMAAGAGFYFLAAATTGLVLLVLAVLRRLDRRL